MCVSFKHPSTYSQKQSRPSATNLVNAFKSNTDRLRDTQAINKLYASPEGRALAEFLVQSLKARNLGTESRPRTKRPVFDAYVARLVERSGASANNNNVGQSNHY